MFCVYDEEEPSKKSKKMFIRGGDKRIYRAKVKAI